MPERIQRKRVKGWKMPPNTVSVTRPGKWGNPFWHPVKFHGVDLGVSLYRNLFEGWNPSTVVALPDSYVHQIYEDHCTWLKRIGHHATEIAISELRGKNLACFCPLDQPCHADVLLEIANA